jgi:hypothetical protein
MFTKQTLLALVRARRAELRGPRMEYTVEDRVWALQQLALKRTPEAKERLAQLKQLLSLAGAGDRRDGDASELPGRAKSAARPISTGRPKANVQLNVHKDVSTAAK